MTHLVWSAPSVRRDRWATALEVLAVCLAWMYSSLLILVFKYSTVEASAWATASPSRATIPCMYNMVWRVTARAADMAWSLMFLRGDTVINVCDYYEAERERVREGGREVEACIACIAYTYNTLSYSGISFGAL